MTTAEYNKCVDQHADGVYRFILKNLKDEERARDIVQESFSRMWEKAEEITAEKAKSYLFTTAYHTMIDDIRREKRTSRLNESHTDRLSVSHNWTDLKEVLQIALDTLPEIQKAVITLRDYEGYSYEEIGRITSLSESQVKVYIYRGRVALKNYIGSLDRVI
ncbi:MAG: RNA polymerase sigma factor [Bacteroidetes bacterium HGW-Bacteroidetes-11]|jgi:RNA polymerase sigma-70 factor (ECF subfamily)|nr:MAG: RNA polymerase sigma factor [Bacteroidetes bacterium HGW-Bacteroidetes-11]